MFRGVYTATSGMIATQRKQEMLTQNLANLNTPGYKADQTVLRAFPDLLIQRIRDQQGDGRACLLFQDKHTRHLTLRSLCSRRHSSF